MANAGRLFAAELEPEALDQVLASYEQALEETRREYVARAESKQIFSLARSKREATLWKLSIEHGVDWADMELRWTRRARQALCAPRRTQRLRGKRAEALPGGNGSLLFVQRLSPGLAGHIMEKIGFGALERAEAKRLPGR